MRRLGLWAFVVVLVVAGAALRLRASRATASGLTTPVASDATPTAQAQGQTSAAERAVVSLFTALDEGRFAEAYDQALEIQWEWGEQRALKPVGLKSRERFIADSEQELDNRGSIISIFEIMATEDKAVPPDFSTPELDALRSLPEAPPSTHIIWVNVQGTVKIACGLRGWERRLAVVQIGDAWKVLLPPPDQARRSRMLGWFPQKGDIIIVR